MKIYIVHSSLLEDVDKAFIDMTDQEVIDLCDKDEDMEDHDVYGSIEEVAGYWNAEEIFYPSDSYMRVIEDKDEPEKVWVFTQESNVNGEMLFNTVVCKDKETAIRMMKQEIDTLLDETTPYEGARQWMEGGDGLNMDDCPYSWENEDDDKFFIKTNCDDYYELITIEEKEIK